MTVRDARLLSAAAVTTAIVRVALWVLPFRRVHAAVERLSRRPRGLSRAPQPIERIVWAVHVAARFMPRATCLTQSLAAHVLLTRHGHSAELRLGVAREDGRFEAHAWVESNGRVVIGNGDRWRFTSMTVG